MPSLFWIVLNFCLWISADKFKMARIQTHSHLYDGYGQETFVDILVEIQNLIDLLVCLRLSRERCVPLHTMPAMVIVQLFSSMV